jgi:hypothetical protein
VADCVARMREARDEQPPGAPPAVANGVHIAAVTAAYLPAALACRKNLPAAAAAAEEVLREAEEACHPPTLCYVLAHLCRDYLRVVGDSVRCELLAQRAEALATAMQLPHGLKLLAAARRWVDFSRDLRMLESGPWSSRWFSDPVLGEGVQDSPAGSRAARRLSLLAGFPSDDDATSLSSA